ncbi:MULTISPECIES: hypothetical protein [unclassified Pseudomonas]|uniref:hypothetical protein n=1 Tax=unclassified Pseudomonas TaxID=196821 RepID=UPI000B8721F9|nr:MULTISPECIES: hypothetical protein [unclassified Pseudomonas]
MLLAANLYGGTLSGTQNPAKIVREIELLEQGELGQLKQPIQATRAEHDQMLLKILDPSAEAIQK